MDIHGFQYTFLSNFWPAPVLFEGVCWPTVEHAYQAAKTLRLEERKRILTQPTPADAKRAGKRVTMRSDWEQRKLQVMGTLLCRKFAHPELRVLLADTAPGVLEETNYWGDTYWGVCRGVGRNELGKMLMLIRDRAPMPIVVDSAAVLPIAGAPLQEVCARSRQRCPTLYRWVRGEWVPRSTDSRCWKPVLRPLSFCHLTDS